jgi:hypothetical protein
MTDDWWLIGKDLEGSGRGLIEVLSPNSRKLSVRRADFPDEIRTEYLQNTSLERHI